MIERSLQLRFLINNLIWIALLSFFISCSSNVQNSIYILEPYGEIKDPYFKTKSENDGIKVLFQDSVVLNADFEKFLDFSDQELIIQVDDEYKVSFSPLSEILFEPGQKLEDEAPLFKLKKGQEILIKVIDKDGDTRDPEAFLQKLHFKVIRKFYDPYRSYIKEKDL